MAVWFVLGAAIQGSAVLTPAGVVGGVYMVAACGYAVTCGAAIQWVTVPPKAVCHGSK